MCGLQELRKLKHSFDHWKETFKKRMRDTYTFVQRARAHSTRRTGGGAGGGGGGRYSRPSGAYGGHPSSHTPTPAQHSHPVPQQPVASSRLGYQGGGGVDGVISPRSDVSSDGMRRPSDDFGSPSENYVRKMREGVMGVTRKGTDAFKAIGGKLSRSISRDESSGSRVGVSAQGTIDARLASKNGHHH